MATIQVTICDECGRQKQETNHWTVIGGDVHHPKLYKSAEDWGSTYASPKELCLDYCSQKCLTTVLQRWMDTGSIEKVQVEHPSQVFEISLHRESIKEI